MVSVRASKSKYAKYAVETVYIGESIDLRKAQEGLKHYSLLNREHPLVVKLLKDTYAVLTKFGAVAFWNVPDRLRTQFLKEVKPYTKAKREYYPYDEDTKVLVGAGDNKITFEKVYLAHFGVDKIKIISYVLSQSVALERYENEIEASLSEVGAIAEGLKSSGRVNLKEKSILKQIGSVLSVKQTAVAHLSLFDKPEEVWESPDLENLYNKLNFEYELKDRFDVLNEKISYLSDVSQMLMNFLAEKRAAFLEVVIIILFILDLALWFLPPFPEVVSYLSRWL
ncbi:MAG TPA: RMD1 family protein [Candidatus Paceibacterota bacterium]|nr:RMD1 family protein [Candidatus Paceibacterota bacterium]